MVGYFLLACAIGGFVAVAEILSRYKDAPWRATATPAGVSYVGFNAGVAALALLVLDRVVPTWSGQAADICLALSPEVRPEEQRALSEQIDAVKKSALSDLAKSVNVGLFIANALGEESLKSGVDLLASRGEAPVDAPEPPTP